jgi:HK97 family phage major capsid protein
VGKAAALRESAIAKFKEADQLVTGDEGPKPEDQEHFDKVYAEGMDLMKQYQDQSKVEGNVLQIREILSDVGGAVKGTGPVPFQTVTIERDRHEAKSLGHAFAESNEYKELVASGNLQSDRSSFRSQPFQAKAATDVLRTNSTTSAGGLVTPDYIAGVQPLNQRPLTVRALFGQGTTNSDTISYAQQTAFDNAAATVAQATNTSTGAKPQSSIGWQRQTSAVETIATWMAATRQTLADAGQIRALIDNQLTLMLQLEEEDQLLNGNGTSPNLSGIYDQTGVQTLNLTGATSNADPNIDGMRTAIRLVATGTSRLRADAVAMNPVDSAEFDLSNDNNGQYRLGGPFGTSVGGDPAPIWGLRRVESEAITAGKALVGAFRAGATVLERQGITILTADQHADFFIRNLIVVLAEERLGFPVYFPTAFVDVTLASWAFLS